MGSKSNLKLIASDQQTSGNVEAPTHYVGVGASAGGLEAIEQFFMNMPPDSGAAFIVIQHLAPDYKSMMVELLSKKTKMEVLRTEDAMVVRPNCIYLIPPKKNLTIFHGKLLLSDQDSRQGLNLPIDIFLRSLAEDQAERAIAIILSGTGSDGTRGVRAIKELGGMVMVQDEGSAKFDGMPRAAASTGVADFILPPDEMPAQLAAYIKHPYVTKETRSDKLLGDEDALTRIFSILRERTKVDFTFYKPSTIHRRLERRMMVNQIEEIGEYVHYLQNHAGEALTLYRELLIGVTSFFRDPEAMRCLTETYLPEVFERSRNREVRFWVAGCSTGEEAYTLAILARQTMEKLDIGLDVKVFATDIDRDAILQAGLGSYPESIAADLSPRLLSKYFYRQDENYLIARHVREMVVFAQHNLVKDPPFTNIDLVSCRNLLIYLQPPLQRRALEMFNFSLDRGGLLFLGSSETVGDMADAFETLHSRFKIFRSRGNSRPVGQVLGAAVDVANRFNDGEVQSTRSRSRFVARDESRVLERLLDALSERHLPMSVVVNERLELVHSLGDSQNYFHLPPGKAVLDITKMATKELSIPLTTGIQKVFRTGEPLTFTNVRLRHLGENRAVRMNIIPLPERKGYESLVVALIEEIERENVRPSDVNERSYDISEEARTLIKDLEQELQFTRENLQATIEELETANEELQATNEELLASNEELQSTNEELQSTNEELHTVNAEYQKKIVELTELNNDVHNLLETSRIGTLLIDENLEIRRFSPQVTKLFRIRSQDIGRPLSHISHDFDGFEPVAAAKTVQETGKPFERELQLADGRWYLVRVVPYEIGPTAVSGCVLTFIDVSELQEVQSDLDASRTMAADLIEHMPAGLFIYSLDDEGRLRLEGGNPEAERLTDLKISEWLGRDFDDIWTAAKEQNLTETFRHVLESGETFYGDQVFYRDERLEGAYRIHAFRLPGHLLAISFEDITLQRQMEQELKESEERHRRLFQLMSNAERTAKLGSWDWDVATDTVTWSDELFSIFQRDPEEGAPSYAEHPTIYSAEDMARLDEAVQGSLKDGTPYELEVGAIRKDGTVRRCITRGAAEHDESGDIIRLYGSLQDVTEALEAEKKLEDAHTRLEFLFQLTGFAWWEWDVQTNVVTASEQKALLLGLKPDEVGSELEFWTSRIHPDDFERAMSAMRDHLEGRRERYEVEYRLEDSAGSYVSLRDRGEITARDDEGRPLRLLGTVQRVEECE